MTNDTAAHFDPLAIPLHGVHSIGASAGTGKTFTIATLYLRYLLETDCRIDQVLVTTFTEAATAELKERLRSRLQEARQVLQDCNSVQAAHELVERKAVDAVVVNVLEQTGAWASRESGRRAAYRLEAAILDFDHAPIFTIHGFCNRLLRELVFETASRLSVELILDQNELVEEVVDDYVARRWADADAPLAQWLDLDESLWKLLRAAASKAADNPRCPIVPSEPALNELLESSLLNEFQHEVEELAELWKEKREEACSLLYKAQDNGWLDDRRYRRTQIDDGIEFVNQFVSSRSPHVFTFEKSGKVKDARQRRLSQAELLNGTTKKYKENAPQHAIFEKLEALIALATDIYLTKGPIQAAMLAELAATVRAELQRKKHELGVLAFSDMLDGVDAALAGPQRELLLDALQARFRVALVDEFQDTDPVQYRIFRQAFQEPAVAATDGTLRAFVMIGDPKQSIYRFRGADIHSYLRAVEQTPSANRHTMDTNWRSDRSLVRAVQAVFDSCEDPFYHEQIPLPPVEAQNDDRFEGGGPLELCFVPRDPERPEPEKVPVKAEVLKHVIPHVASDIVMQLHDQQAVLHENGSKRRVTPGDIAVLCREGNHLRLMQEALAHRSVPAVLQTEESIFDTSEAETMVHVLRAILEPQRRTLLTNTLLTPLFGRDAEELEKLRQDEEEFAEWGRRFHGWHDLWHQRGFMVAWRRLLDEEGVLPRLTGLITGERQATNYLHLGELLHCQAVDAHTGPTQMLRWLVQAIGDPRRRPDDQAQLRLETDAAALQLCTIHKSKGLEYPVVYCPTLWDVYGGQPGKVVLARFDEKGEPLEIPELDVGSEQLKTRIEWNKREEEAEERRQLYVALTRAKHQCRIYWTACEKAQSSALGKIIMGPLDEHTTDDALKTGLQQWCDGSGESGIRLRAAGPSTPDGYRPAEQAPVELSSRSISRADVPSLVQTSFTALARSLDFEAVDEAVDRDDTDRAVPIVETQSVSEGEESTALPLADMPGGRKVGDLVHRVLEEILASDGLREAERSDVLERVGERLDVHLPRVQLDPQWRDPLAQTLTRCLTAPLPVGPSPCRLAELDPAQLACELRFVLRAGSDGSLMDSGTIGPALAHSSNPLVQAYGHRANGMDGKRIRGFLEGYIDLVFAWENKWYLLDYKTNRLGRTAADYERTQLDDTMTEHDYVLQYHLYALALDQMLRQRVPGYTYERDFGGVIYLFIRGLDPAPDSPRGIYLDRPETNVIESLTSMLAGEAVPCP